MVVEQEFIQEANEADSLSMDRDLNIQLRSATWPRGTSPPASMVTGMQSFHIPSVLLLIGQLTTPPHRAGISLSEYWAYVRYLNALTGRNILELTKEYADLDSHQKTILSDDFGMGFAMDYLTRTLDLTPPVDGRYFVKNMLGATGATYSGGGKVGPGKTPDFVALDRSGKWHVVECKGTQSDSRYQTKQLDAGRVQKQTIDFPSSVRGERIVASLQVGSEQSKFDSVLVIEDPEPEDPVHVKSDELPRAADAVHRGALAVALQLAGFPASSSLISAPDGDEPGAETLSGQAESNRLQSVRRKRELSTREFQAAADRIADGGYIGRAVEFELPGLRELSDGRIAKAKITNGISKDLIERMQVARTYDFRQSLADQIGVAGDELDLRREGSGNSAELAFGKLYRARIELN